ncbi:MAG: class I SAM-dependent methyltransferase [Pseudomonadota bacterium]
MDHLLQAGYDIKETSYYDGVRKDWIDRLPEGGGLRILEIGCADGGTGHYALVNGRAAFYAGVELMPGPAAKAEAVLSQVITGDVEKLSLPFEPESFDALLMSEVLEHFVDPWAALTEKLVPLLKPGARVFASSPNVAHRAVLRQLLRGRWDLTDSGTMDRTHLRWFTPATYREMLEGAGVEIDHIGPLDTSPAGFKQRVVNFVTGGCFDHLYWYQINAIGHRRR